MTSDESSYSTSDLDERPDDKSTLQDETLQKTEQQLEHPVQFKASDPPVLADKTERFPAKFANRLRRQPAVISLSKQYLESGECITRKSHEAGTAQRQTIHPTAATQVSQDGTNYRTSRHRLLSAATNQPGKIKISSGSPGASAQTEATTSEAYLWEDEIDSAGQQCGHKIDFTIGSGSEDTDSRSSIASEETASIRGFGDARATIRLAQHSETPKLSPLRAEFLNTCSNGARYESILPPRRDLSSSAHYPTGERSKPGRNQSFTARLDEFSAPADRLEQNQRQTAMRVETSPRREWGSHDDDLVKLAATYHWGHQSNPKEWPHDADSLLQQRLHHVPGTPADRPHRNDAVLGQARAVKMSKPGEARLVKIYTNKSRRFNINCLSTAEADLMASMGAMARSSRRSSAWADDEQFREGSPVIDAAAEIVDPKRGSEKSRIPKAIPRVEEGAARSSKQQPVREEPGDGHEDVRFHQLVGRLETSYPKSTLPTAIPADTNPNPRDSGCPSLISDDSRDSTSSPSDMAHGYARAQIFEGNRDVSGWESDESASTVAPHEAPSRSSFDLFDISADEDELVPGADASEDQTDENTSDGEGRGRRYQEAREIASYSSLYQANLSSRIRDRRRDASTTGKQPNELNLYAKCAILRWMHSTTDAPDTPRMHDESGRWWELLDVKDTYQLRYGDETRSEILRELRFLADAEERQPEPSHDVQAFLRECSRHRLCRHR